MKKFLTVLVLCFVVGIGLSLVFRDKTATAPNLIGNKETVFPVQVLKNESFTDTKSFIGSVQAIQTVEVVPYLSGFLKEVRVQSGEEVKEGDVLFLLDERIPSADLEQAKEAVSQAYAARENALDYYKRMQKTDSKAVSPTDLEQAKTEFEAADAAYQKALAAQNQAQTLYDYTIIQAPISGWVGNITATVGEYLSPESKSLATIIRFSPIRLTFSIPMAAYKGRFSTDNAIMEVVMGDGQTLKLTDFKVVRDNHVDKSTDSLPFFADVDNSEKRFVPGAFVEINFLYPKTGILVNKNWTTLTSDGAEVYILKGGIIEKRNVEIGASVGNQYWIKSGLAVGEMIITVPVSSRQIGQKAKGVQK